MKQTQPFQKHWLQLTSIVVCRLKANKIVRLQKRAIRVITNSKPNTHVEPLLKKLNLLEISDIFRNSLLKLYYKYKSGNLPHYVMHMFCAEPNVHNYNTRSNTTLNHPVTNLLFGSEKCVIYHLPRLFEETDSNILKKKWTRIAILGSVYISGKYVCKITSLNATSQIVTRAEMCKFDNKIWILYVFWHWCIYKYIYFFLFFSFYFLVPLSIEFDETHILIDYWYIRISCK